MILKTQNQGTDVQMPVLIYSTKAELKELLSNLLTEHLPPQNDFKLTSYEPENVCDKVARGILSGDQSRPVSKPFFNALRNKGYIKAYQIGDSRRLFYRRSEIMAYLASKNPIISKTFPEPNKNSLIQ